MTSTRSPKLNYRHLIGAIGLLLFATWLNFTMSELIHAWYPERQPAIDTLFRLTPYVGWTQYLTDIANIASIVLLAVYVFPKRIHTLPFVLTVFGIAEVMRGLIIILTPMGGPLGNVVHYGLTTINQYGEFPSGHTIVVTVAYLLVNKKEAPVIKGLLLFSLIAEIVSLILSRGHYSIDIIGGMLVSYFAYHELTKRTSPKTSETTVFNG